MVNHRLHTLNIFSEPDPLPEDQSKDPKDHIIEEYQKMKIDYSVIFKTLDVLEILGMITKKFDASCSQKWFYWRGYQGFRTKFAHILCPDPDTKSFMIPEKLRKSDKYTGCNAIVKFFQEYLLRLVSCLGDGSEFVSSIEFKKLKD